MGAGPKSAEVVQYVRRIPNVLCVLGNHDEALLKVRSCLSVCLFGRCVVSVSVICHLFVRQLTE
jgi:hypothetical protein